MFKSDFDRWLVANWSFDPDGTPTRHRPPKFTDGDLNFDVKWYESWLEERRKDYETMVAGWDDDGGSVGSTNEGA
jgi:hypothetical protein